MSLNSTRENWLLILLDQKKIDHKTRTGEISLETQIAGKGDIINKQDKIICIHCGSLRIISRVWKEKVDGRGSVVTHTESVCTNDECQRTTDERFREMRERRKLAEEKRKSIVLAKRTKVAS